MRILLIGGGGLLGSSLAITLVNSGHDVTVLDNYTGSSPPVKPEYRVITGNASFFNIVNNVYNTLKPEVVFHFADSSISKDTIYKFEDESDTAISIANNILRCNGLYGIKFMFLGSSGEVYKDKRGIIGEDSVVGAYSYTGTTKLYIEDMFNLNSSIKGYRFISFRFGQIFGARKNPNPKHDLVSFFIDAILRGRGISIIGPNLLVDLLYSEDAVKAIKLVFDKITQNEIDQNIFNISSGKGVKIIDLYNLISKRVLGEIPKVYKFPPKKQTRTLVLDNSLVGSFGWEPEVNLKDKLDELIEYRKGTLDVRKSKKSV